MRMLSHALAKTGERGTAVDAVSELARAKVGWVPVWKGSVFPIATLTVPALRWSSKK